MGLGRGCVVGLDATQAPAAGCEEARTMTRLHKAILVVHALLAFGAGATSVGALAGAFVFALGLVPLGYHALLVMRHLPREREQAERVESLERANEGLRLLVREQADEIAKLQAEAARGRRFAGALREGRRP